MRLVLSLVPLLVSACLLSAAPMKLDSLSAGSVTYSNVTILGANTTDLYFTHQYGIGNVKLKYLSADLQKRFNYDARAAAEAERKRAADDAQYQRALAASMATQAKARGTADENEVLTLADPVSDTSLLGKPAPPLSVEKWLGEKPVLEHKPVIITFWAPASAASRKWIPELNALQKEFTNTLAVVGLCADTEAAVTNMVTPKVEFALALDPQSRLRSAAGVTSIPTVMFVDAEGIVRYLGHPAALSSAVLKTWLPKPAEAAAPPK